VRCKASARGSCEEVEAGGAIVEAEEEFRGGEGGGGGRGSPRRRREPRSFVTIGSRSSSLLECELLGVSVKREEEGEAAWVVGSM